MEAQLTESPGKNNKLAGEYYLQDVIETASGFKLNPDSAFEFFFIYGALDQSGSGTRTVQHNNILLNSKPRPGKDFALVRSKKTNDDSLVIKIVEANTFFLSHVYCLLSSGDKNPEQLSNKQGLINFPKQAANTIMLPFEFCPERTSLFQASDPTDNYFEFRFEPWILEVFFADFKLEINKDELKGPHPLLTGPSYRFVKNK